MCESEPLEKNMTVGSGRNSYKAVSEADLLNIVKPLFKKQKLIIFPIDGDIKDHVMEYEKTDYEGKQQRNLRAITELKVHYRILDIETGEHQDIVGFGNGADPQDKGAGKAFTYSFKNALSKTFMLFTGEDTDNTHSDDIYKSDKAIKDNQPSKATIKAKYQALGWKMDDFEAWYSEQIQKFKISQIDGFLGGKLKNKVGV